MRRNKLALYLHLVWTTWDRLPTIASTWERRLYRCIAGEARDKGCTILAINGMPDHVHLCVTLPATLTVAELVKRVKGVSSRFVNKGIAPHSQFKWAGGYGAFSISRWDVDTIVGYVRRQKEHHAEATTRTEWEEASEQVPSA
jgi:REP element-mobilizing transposase RayT